MDLNMFRVLLSTLDLCKSESFDHLMGYADAKHGRVDKFMSTLAIPWVPRAIKRIQRVYSNTEAYYRKIPLHEEVVRTCNPEVLHHYLLVLGGRKQLVQRHNLNVISMSIVKYGTPEHLCVLSESVPIFFKHNCFTIESLIEERVHDEKKRKKFMKILVESGALLLGIVSLLNNPERHGGEENVARRVEGYIRTHTWAFGKSESPIIIYRNDRWYAKFLVTDVQVDIRLIIKKMKERFVYPIQSPIIFPHESYCGISRLCDPPFRCY